MMARKFFIIGAIMIKSLLGAQAFAAGSDDYAPTAAKPAAYNKALALIKDKICWLGCSELDDLRTAIRNYKP